MGGVLDRVQEERRIQIASTSSSLLEFTPGLDLGQAPMNRDLRFATR